MFDETTEKLIERVVKNTDMPTLEEIEKDYEEVRALLLNVKDIEKLRKIAKEYRITIEVNGEDDYENKWNLSENEVEMVRVEHWGNLDYVYFIYGEHCIIYFDVWCDDYFDDVIVDTTIGKLEDDYLSACHYIDENRICDWD